MENNSIENFKMLKSAYERFICITLFFALLFFIVMQKPEILITVIEQFTDLIKTSGLDLGNIITTIILSKLYK